MRPNDSGRFEALTAIRGLGTLWMAAFDARGTTFDGGVHPSWGMRILNAGWLPVDLFFVLSGLVIPSRARP